MKYILILLVIMNVFISCGKQKQFKELNENNSKFIAINYSNEKPNYSIVNYKLSCKKEKFSDVILKENMDNKLFYQDDSCSFVFTKMKIGGVHFGLDNKNNMLSLSENGEMIQVTTPREDKKEIYYVKTRFIINPNNTKIITVSVYPKNIDINKNYFEYKMHEPKVGSDEIENLIRNKYAQIKKDPRVDKKPLESLLKMVLSKGGGYNSIAEVYSNTEINRYVDSYISSLKKYETKTKESEKWRALLHYLKYNELLKILQDLLGKKKNILHLSVKIPKNNNLEIVKIYEIKNHSTEKELTINEFLAETIQTEDSSNVFYFKSNCLENESDSKTCDIYFIDTNTDINLDKRKIITDFKFKDKSDNRILETVAISTESYQSVYSYGTYTNPNGTTDNGIFRANGIQPEGCRRDQVALIDKCKLVQFTRIESHHNSVEFIELPDAGVCFRISNNTENREIIQGFNTSSNCSDLFNNSNDILKLGEKINIYYDIANENYKETTGYKNSEKFKLFVRFEGASLDQSYWKGNGTILSHYYEPVTIWKKIEFAEP